MTAKFRKRYPDVRIRVSVPEDLLFVPMDGKPQMVQGAIGKDDFEKVINDVLLQK